MSHLNYFEPFQSKTKKHEDQLTRAFLVVLRYSPTAILMFYDRVKQSVIKNAKNKNIQVNVDSISSIDITDIYIETQKSKIDNITSNKIISVLITDEEFEATNKIESSTRGAIYDGIITYGSDITFLIENKPNSYDIREEQLHPNLSKLSNNYELVKVPGIVEWKEIIKNLNQILLLNSVSGAEKLLINDFLEYINDNYGFLNPYDNFNLCKNNVELIQKRLRNILQQIVSDEDYISYQVFWHNYIIITGLPELKMIVFEIGKDKADITIAISMYFGDTMVQAREYYKSQIPYSSVEQLVENGWKYYPDFHISHIQKHLVWFSTKQINEKKYYDYWCSNLNSIRQYNKEDLESVLNKLKDEGIIVIEQKENEELDKKVIQTNRNIINICPAFCLSYTYSFQTAVDLDSKNKFSNELKSRILEGVGILNKDVAFIKTSGY